MHDTEALADIVTDILQRTDPQRRLWLLDTAAAVLHRLPEPPCRRARCEAMCRACLRALSLGIVWLDAGGSVHLEPRRRAEPQPEDHTESTLAQVAERLRARRLGRAA